MISDPKGTPGQALEAFVLRQLLGSVKVFGGEGAGAHVYADMFADALGQAVAGAGGIGLARLLESPPANGSEAALPSLPAQGRISSPFGTRADPFTQAPRQHRGVDIAAREGAPITAALPGRVVFAGERGGYGLTVELEHPGGLRTLYAHAQSLEVQVGQEVARGAPLAKVGSTGRSTGPHLHFEVREGGRAVDPQKALKRYAQRAEEPLVGATPTRRP